MRITFLGSGTSHGVPVIGCDCRVCRSDDPRNQRLRPSVWIQAPDLSVLVDAPPDFRQQALRAKLDHVDAVMLTHTHADHFLGMDDLRVFTTRRGGRTLIYGSQESLNDVERVFAYACAPEPRWPTLPKFGLVPIQPWQKLQVGELTVLPVPLPHGYMTVLGFVFGRELAYLTDCNAVPPEVIDAVRGVTMVVLDAVRHRPHPTHLSIGEAQHVATQIGAPLALFTHLSHDICHEEVESTLPANIRLAYDGMQFEVNDGAIRQLD